LKGRCQEFLEQQPSAAAAAAVAATAEASVHLNSCQEKTTEVSFSFLSNNSGMIASSPLPHCSAITAVLHPILGYQWKSSLSQLFPRNAPINTLFGL